MDRDGYLLLRGFFDRDALLQIRRRVLEICRETGWLLDDPSPDDARVRLQRSEVTGEQFHAVMPRLFGLEEVTAFFHAPPILEVMHELIGEPVVPHIHKQVRIQFPVEPGKPPQTTGAHQDFVYNQGSTEVYSCWVPVGDVPREAGGLEVLAGSHRHGVHEIRSVPAGSITYSVGDAEQAGEWIQPDYRLGDAILFHSLTVHRAPANYTNSLRISIDCRYQGISQPFTTLLLQPLPGVIEAYPRWKSKELQYYWKRLDLKVVDHDMSYLEQMKAARR
jgi:ectoine hydroxylase-related dioxygenase (phytanoyl-CoA dioxygenase family)